MRYNYVYGTVVGPKFQCLCDPMSITGSAWKIAELIRKITSTKLLNPTMKYCYVANITFTEEYIVFCNRGLQTDPKFTVITFGVPNHH